MTAPATCWLRAGAAHRIVAESGIPSTADDLLRDAMEIAILTPEIGDADEESNERMKLLGDRCGFCFNRNTRRFHSEDAASRAATQPVGRHVNDGEDGDPIDNLPDREPAPMTVWRSAISLGAADPKLKPIESEIEVKLDLIRGGPDCDEMLAAFPGVSHRRREQIIEEISEQILERVRAARGESDQGDLFLGGAA
ncbi:MAG: hypothetical protein Q8O25_08315 [Sulfurisoma sp.]|nr:hypothetical protein [Sulfurisoma sp.]